MSDRDPAVKSDRTAQARPSAPRVRLSCEACRQRKVKCDKLSPCTSCQRLGFVCVPVERARLPRGRTRKAPERVGSSDKELADRVAKLEQLLRKVAAERDEPMAQSLAEEVPSFNEPTEHSFEANVHVGDAEAWRNQIDDSSEMKPVIPETQPPRPRAMNNYLGSSFWEDIMLQVALAAQKAQKVFRTPLSPIKGSQFPPQTRRTLCDIYLSNVDPVFKVLHRPSLRAYLHDDQPYLDYEPDHQAPITLALAVYSAAVCTIDDSQCHFLFGMDQKSAFADLQRETEAALTRADFVTTNDLTVLQAYVISLLAARCQDQSRRVWTMLSMALRVAQAQCLHMFEPSFHVDPFEQEMRRRCWQAIGQLDIAASLDRASEPMMQVAWLESHPPANINDEDIWPGMEGPIKVPPEGTFTEMTLALVVGASQSVCRSVGFADFIEISVKSLSVRQQLLADCQKRISILLAGCHPDRHPFHLYTKRIASIINGCLQLACVRPIIRSRNFNPPAIQGDVLLRMAGENLKRASESYSDPAMTPWRWFGALWVPWHGLAVALAELCVCQDPATISKFWPIVEHTYQITSTFIADSQHGMLWRPLEKLMNQARTRKREILGDESLTNAISQVTLEGMPLSFAAEHLNHQNAQNPHNSVNFSLGSMEAPMVPVQQNAPVIPMAPMTMGFGSDVETWPNVWDAMDLSGTVPQGGYDVAWASYTNFIGDVYDSADSMFLPR
ncbi:uncharacterized protein N7483_008799 [Penicillium malachiteum]|uniref:uncharacterized protein n=1 Tax=Penicillium malachiteum TaxID=1324776 RepID=UPI00254921C1|nr:uncharacterized protein N7483_008799 [Penicillium malachiteum]KAJ5720865.1 hypothetical protein N7483_008799 [Penicillium malachiteum]